MKGKDLKNYRIQLDWTQEDTANRLEVTIRTVQYWESDKRSIPKSVELYFDLLLQNNNEQLSENPNKSQTPSVKILANELYKILEPKIIKLIFNKTSEQFSDINEDIETLLFGKLDERGDQIKSSRMKAVPVSKTN